MFIVGQHAMDGSITGAMPSDKKLREKFIAAGKKPYSFVVKKEGFPEGMPPFDKYGRPNGPLRYVSYNGFGPASSLIGLVANTMQRAVLTRDPELRNNYFSAAVFGAAEYFTELPIVSYIMVLLARSPIAGLTKPNTLSLLCSAFILLDSVCIQAQSSFFGVPTSA